MRNDRPADRTASTNETGGSRNRPRRSWRVPPAGVVVPTILILLSIVFIFENRQIVAIRVIIPVVVMPMWVALASLFLIGLATGLVWRRRR